MYESVKLSITPKQINRLRNGHKVQFKAHQLMESTHAIVLHPETARKVHKARKMQKGVRIQLADGELAENHGAGFFDDLKKVGRKVKKAIKSDFYQNSVRPLTGKIVREGVNRFVKPTVGSYMPGLDNEIDNLVEGISKETGAYGVGKLKKFTRKVKKGVKKAIQSEAYDKYVKPNIKKYLDEKQEELMPAFLDRFGDAGEPILNRSVDFIRQNTGAYGMKSKKAPRRRGKFVTEDNYSNFIGIDHPAMHPMVGKLPPSGQKAQRIGSSFRAN